MRNICFLICCLPLLGHAQSNTKIDSISQLIQVETSDSLTSSMLIQKSLYHNRAGQKDSAMAAVNDAIVLANQADIRSNATRAYVLLGNYYLNVYQYDLAFKNYSIADSICKITPHLQESTNRARALNFMGYAVRLTHDYEKAAAFYRQAKAMYERLDNELGLHEVNIGLAQSYIAEDRMDEALPLLNDAVAYYEERKSMNAYAYAVICRGFLYVKMKRFEEGEQDYLTHYNISIEKNSKPDLLRSLSYMGYFYLEKGDYPKSIDYYSQGVALAKEEESLFMLEETQEGLINALKKGNRLQQLGVVYDDYIETKNKLDSVNKSTEIYNLEAKYQTQQKEQEIALLTAQNSLSEQRRRSQQYQYLGILVLVMALLAVLFFNYRNKLKVAKRLKELDALKSRFFANISHEFRTPLTLIKSPVSTLRSTMPNEDQEQQLNLIDANAQRMLELVDQLLELSKIEGNHLKIILKKGNVAAFLRTVIEPFEFRAQETDIPFEKDIESTTSEHLFDRDILAKVVVNLLSNAFKYRDAGTTVRFESKMENHFLLLKVSNVNGQLEAKNIKKLFERFYQQDGAATGFGIGLSLVKDLVELYDGSIDVQLDREVVTFTLKMPLTTDKKNAVVIDEPAEKISEEKNLDAFENDAIPILLIADDNSEIRKVVAGIFSKEYHILEARDGEEAFQLAQNCIPDAIISDVMMPKMDGFALATRLKNDELTSLIPLVLLTAKTSEEAHLNALKSAADVFLTKPFNHDILVATITQLRLERKKLQEYYSRELILRPMEIAISTADERFIERLEAVIKTELMNPNLSADQFATHMGMSRMQLHRKLKSLFGVPTSEFIRNERLKTAAELLKNMDLSVAEVAYSSGFNEATYFSKSFRKVYGLSPTEFRRNLK